MEFEINILFNKFLQLVHHLTPIQKQKLQQALNNEPNDPLPNNDLKTFLLNGPVFSSMQLKTIKQTRKSINQWRTK